MARFDVSAPVFSVSAPVGTAAVLSVPNDVLSWPAAVLSVLRPALSEAGMAAVSVTEDESGAEGVETAVESLPKYPLTKFSRASMPVILTAAAINAAAAIDMNNLFAFI